jgi:prephenate dehydrogenase
MAKSNSCEEYMSIQITLIGLGQIGGSIGLALAKNTDKLVRVGHDREIAIEREALKKGAVDRVEHNLPRAVENAQLVLLALPIGEIRDTLKFIAADLKPGTVVVDTASVKAEVSKWAKEILPEGTYYVGIVPAIGAGFLRDEKTGLDSASADLFSKSIFLLSAPPGAPGEAVELVSDLVKLLGATPMLTDPLETDGFSASAELLPQLVSAALLNATINQPGWKDARKVASRKYMAATSAVDLEDLASLEMLSLHNTTNTIRSIDMMINALRAYREDIESGNQSALKNRLASARDGREEWIHERTSANWVEMQRDPADYPSVSERLFGSLTGRKINKKK